MKILYKNMGFGGGAPRSLLEYARIAISVNHEVVCVGQYTYDPIYYNKNGVRTHNINHAKITKPVHTILTLIKYYFVIRKEKPDVIHVITSEECLFQRVLSTLLDIPTIYTLPGGKVNQIFAEIMDNEELLVFSEENKIDLLKYGYNDNKIRVITNRINFSVDDSMDRKFYYNNSIKTINMLFIGRVNSNFESIKEVINLVEELTKDGYSIKLKVVGDGGRIEELVKLSENINNKYHATIVEFEGYKKNVLDYIKKSHIVFGKGRSIIDAVINYKVAFVVGENREIYPINPKSIVHLSDHNFAGRHKEEGVNYNYIKNILNNIIDTKIDYQELNMNREKVAEKYDINKIKETINELYESKYNRHQKQFSILRIIKSIKIYFLIYIKYIIYHNKFRDYN